MCDSSFKKKITLEKHKNTKHCSSNQKIGEGQFGFSFDVIPGNEAEAAELRLEWKEKKNNDKTSNKNDNEKSEYSKKCKESEVFNEEDYFQLEYIDGEPLFVCYVCDEGFDSEAEITQHIEEKHESLMNDDSLDDSDLYKGFDEEGHRIS